MGILDNFLIQSIENRFGDDEVVFQDDNATWYRATEIKGKLRGAYDIFPALFSYGHLKLS